MSKVITRIAPSPTGKLHIGTARTALFNYLFAKDKDDKFLLRFEDTDPKRSKKEFEEDIKENLKWLGLSWSEKPERQSKRGNKYKKALGDLKEKGFVYLKEGAWWLDVKKVIDAYKIDNKYVENQAYAKWESDKSAKLLSIDEGYLIESEKEDIILGKISGVVKDLVLMRSEDNTATYHFAVVVDDNDMGVTHVVRGQDHFTNTPKQYLIIKALDYELPNYAHIPLTLNPDKSKLSKRTGAVAIADFKNEGYLPEALINYIALLGWHPSGPKWNDEVMFGPGVGNLFDNLKKEFSLEGMQKSNAIFDRKKLDFFNSTAIRFTGNKELISRMRDIIDLPDADEDYLERVIDVTKDRMKKLTDFEDLSRYYFGEIKYDPNMLVFKKSDKERSYNGLVAAFDELNKDIDWGDKDKLKEALVSRMESESLSFGDMFWPVRAALSGEDKSPGPDELLWVLGKEESLKRLEKAIDLLK